jgi:hypothetical protein
MLRIGGIQFSDCFVQLWRFERPLRTQGEGSYSVVGLGDLELWVTTTKCGHGGPSGECRALSKSHGAPALCP